MAVQRRRKDGMTQTQRPNTDEPAAQDPAQLGALSPHERSSGRRSWAMHRWHKENVRLFPKDLYLYSDVSRLFAEYILPGHLPDRPVLTADDKVVTLGPGFPPQPG